MSRAPLVLLADGLANAYDTQDLPEIDALLDAGGAARLAAEVPEERPRGIRVARDPFRDRARRIVAAPRSTQARVLAHLTEDRVLSERFWTPAARDLLADDFDPVAHCQAAEVGSKRILGFLAGSFERGVLDQVPAAWRRELCDDVRSLPRWLNVQRSPAQILRTGALIAATGQILRRTLLATLGRPPRRGTLDSLADETPRLLRDVVPLGPCAWYHARTGHQVFGPATPMAFVGVESALLSLLVAQARGRVTRLLSLPEDGDSDAHRREVFRLYLVQMLGELCDGHITTRLTVSADPRPSFAAWRDTATRRAGRVVQRGREGAPLLCFDEEPCDVDAMTRAPEFRDATPLLSWLRAS